METLDQLQAIEAIRQLKARYCLCVDHKRWDELRQLFTPDATTETGGQGRWRDVDAFVDKVAAIFATARTLHSVSTSLITLHSSTSASGSWSMEDRLWFADANAPGGWRHWLGSGRYRDDYVLLQGRWLIRTMQLERVDPMSAA